MKITLKIKLFLYRFFSTSFGKNILHMLSFGVRVKNLKNSRKPKNYPFFVVITTDTESGYVNAGERRVWQKEDPRAYSGYHYGMRNLMKIFDKHKIKTTFFLSTNCFSSIGKEYNSIKKELENIIRKGQEIGLHLHPDSDLALQKELSKRFDATSAFFYDYKEKLSMIKASKKLIEQNLGKSVVKNLISFRWGNWALDTDGAKALNKSGFKIDSSSTPGINGHTNDSMRYDWSSVKSHYPWKLSTKNYRATNHNNSNITEIPIATFDFFGLKLRADPVNSVLLNKAFLEYYGQINRLEQPFPFVVITHSSEATNKDGQETQALKDLDAFINFAKKQKNVEFVTLGQAYEKLTIS